jgi:hypothetical protein
LNWLADATARERSRDAHASSGAWDGLVATDAADLSDPIYVRIPDLAGDLQIGPCRWQSRDDTSLPARNDRCLVVFANNTGEPWVVAWWPFDET